MKENIMARQCGTSSNSLKEAFHQSGDIDFDAVFDELARWNDILRHEDTSILRGPRP